MRHKYNLASSSGPQKIAKLMENLAENVANKMNSSFQGLGTTVEM